MIGHLAAFSFLLCPLPPQDTNYTGPVDQCGLPLQSVPGPAPVLGAAAAWHQARRIRRRIREREHD